MMPTPDQYVIQADASRGVNEYGRAREARSWAGFTHYGLMPDADYSETPEAVQPQDADVMARTICGEARGGSYQDKIAV